MHNVHQETKHGPFTNMSQAQGTITAPGQDQKPQIQLQAVHDMKPIVSLHGGNSVGGKGSLESLTRMEINPVIVGPVGQHQPEIKLIHTLTKIPHNPL